MLLKLPLEVYIYAISFFIFMGIAVFYGYKSVKAFIDEKKKKFEDFLSTSHYLQSVSLDYIMKEKDQEDDIDEKLIQLQKKTKEEIQKIEKDSQEVIDQQAQKLKEEFAYKMKMMNAKFIHETKSYIVDKMMDEVQKKLHMLKAK